MLTKDYLSSEKVYDPTALIFDRLDRIESKLESILKGLDEIKQANERLIKKRVATKRGPVANVGDDLTVDPNIIKKR